MLRLMFLGQILSMLYYGTLDNRNILSASFELKRLVALLTNDWSTFPAVPPWVRWFKTRRVSQGPRFCGRAMHRLSGAAG